MKPLNTSGQQLAGDLSRQKLASSRRQQELRQSEKVNIVGAGGTITAVYEQLRNAAENTEEHLLLQNAIRRFYRQLFIMRDGESLRDSGKELAIELTLAGYIPNDHLTRQQVQIISELAQKYYAAYESLLSKKSISSDQASSWTLDVLSVEVEGVINDHGLDVVFVDFAYADLESVIDKDIVGKDSVNDFGAVLYVAIHQALLKADVATIRTGLLQRFRVPVENLDQYVTFNIRIDSLLRSDAVDTLRRVVDRQGAPLRILRRMMDDEPEIDAMLARRDVFLSRYEQQVTTEYERIGRRINRAIIRSVIFLIITKFLIGIAVEVPYDYLVHGGIIWLPLIINLLFPPIYMVILRATHGLPGMANTSALVDRIDHILYGEQTQLSSKRLRGKTYGVVFSALYVLSGLAIFAAVTYILLQLSFSLLHIAIFFVFLSAASFLGFRLSRFIREVEVVRSAQNGMTFVRDLLYLPFVVVGQWMSDKYSQINVVTIILDMLIELPMKTILRLVRQWSAFIDDRKDRL